MIFLSVFYFPYLNAVFFPKKLKKRFRNYYIATVALEINLIQIFLFNEIVPPGFKFLYSYSQQEGYISVVFY